MAFSEPFVRSSYSETSSKESLSFHMAGDFKKTALESWPRGWTEKGKKNVKIFQLR